MEAIQPIKWSADKPEATQLNVWNINDDLTTQCLFGWQLLTEEGALVDNGTIQCAGVDYSKWDGNRKYPYTFTAENLGVTLL